MQLSESEQKFVLLKAELAKTERHIAELKTRAERAFTEGTAIRCVTYEQNRPQLSPIKLELDLLNLQPGQLKAAAENVDEIIDELSQACKQFAALSLELRSLNGVSMRVNVEFQ